MSATNTGESAPAESTISQDENPLDRGKLFQTISQILPPADDSNDDRAALKSAADLTMALFVAAMVRFGFRFLGIGEHRTDRTEPTEPTSTDAAPTPLPSDWNASGDMFSFRFKHSQSSLTFLLKGVKVGSKLVIHGVAAEDDNLHTIELSLPTFVSPSFKFPCGRSGLDAAFASEDQLYAVLTEFRVKIVQKLIPGLNKPGFEPWKNQPSADGSSSSSQQPDRRGPPYFHPIPSPETNPHYPGQQPHNPHGEMFPGPHRNPFNIGDADLDPLAASPGLVGYPRPGGLAGGGGMFVGPDHPMFGGGGLPRPGVPPEGLPFGAAPPGARYDPIGPFAPRGGGPMRPPGRGGFGGPGRGGFPGGGGGGGFSGDPDNDELPPPGYNDMFM
ncbi:hypothetical protein HDU87_005137 [Geranomyces variabilis]|uniref:Proteasome inhibitor PI31 subunit n=1 Tax=Geranomyces variabilis TaxID=109894 RepID=A0AAD5TR51_9FUNG|nr:hypothetical protein HDU87_005137 [Geranomyces variabilis]